MNCFRTWNGPCPPSKNFTDDKLLSATESMERWAIEPLAVLHQDLGVRLGVSSAGR